MNKFNINDYTILNKLLEKYKKINYSETIEWQNRINDDVNFLFQKWNIKEYSINKDAYTGIVMECISFNNNYRDVIIKIYPSFISFRYIKEKFILQNLNNYPQAQLIDYDDSLYAMLIEKVIPGNYIEFDKDKQQVFEMFSIITNNRREIKELVIPKEVMSITEQTRTEMIIANNYNYNKELVNYLVICQNNIYKKTFINETKYLLHGDIYYKNAIKSQYDIKIIDPVGYKDAFIFEYMPLLTYELINNSSCNDYIDEYKKLLQYFAIYTDISRLHEAVFIFLVKQLVPSIYEADDKFERANKFLNLIKILFLNNDNSINLDKVKI